MNPRSITLCSIALALLTAPAAAQRSPIEAIGWIAGCWIRTAPGLSTEEQWMAPRAGMMLGMSRSVGGGRVVDYEALRIEERGDQLVYVAQPSGQAVAEFTAREPGGSVVVFENLKHDFPQRIIYRQAGADSLVARIEGERDGTIRGVDFAYARTACPG